MGFVVPYHARADRPRSLLKLPSHGHESKPIAQASKHVQDLLLVPATHLKDVVWQLPAAVKSLRGHGINKIQSAFAVALLSRIGQTHTSNCLHVTGFLDVNFI